MMLLEECWDKKMQCNSQAKIDNFDRNSLRILNIAGYQFVALQELASLQQSLLAECELHMLKGTILLSDEGINVNLAGFSVQIYSFIAYLKRDPRFCAIKFHEAYSDRLPFRHLKIKLKKEIITLRQQEANPTCENQAPRLSPKDLKQWLDEKRDVLLLDTRNDYEVRFGTFKGALNLQLTQFGKLPTALNQLDKNQQTVLFCTGGIRCEKAGLYMQNQGFSNIYQLDGGILGYFAQVGGEHYDGECFVFDERISVDTHLTATGTKQCHICHGPIFLNTASSTLLEHSCASSHA